MKKLTINDFIIQSESPINKKQLLEDINEFGPQEIIIKECE